MGKFKMKTNYQTKKLDDVCEIIMGQSPASSTYNEKGEGLPFYQGKKDYGKKYPTPRVWCSLPIKIVEDADILISVRAPVGALNISKEKSCIGRGLAGLRAKEGLDQKYLWYFLKLRKKNIADLGTGSTFTAISKKHLENLEISLPPLAEQKKIVARIEKVFAKIDEAARLRVEAQKATAKLLPATLHEIFDEGKKKGWEEKEFKDVVSVETKRNTKKLPYVGMEDVEGGTGIFLGSKEIKEVRSSTSYFNTEHVLYGKLRPYLNKVLIPDFEGHCSTEFLPLRPYFEFLTREWLAVWMKSEMVVSKINNTNAGARMPRANMKEVKKFSIPLPPLAEQKKIVARLDELSTKIRTLQEAQSTQLADLKALKQSILHEAFNGELV